MLLDLARTRFAKPIHESERRLLVERAQKLLDTGGTSLAETERWYWSAVSERLSGQTARAIPLYQQAVDLQPDSVEWRMELAQTFQEAGRINDAVREVGVRLMAPKTTGVEALLARDLVRQQMIGSNRNDARKLRSRASQDHSEPIPSPRAQSRERPCRFDNREPRLSFRRPTTEKLTTWLIRRIPAEILHNRFRHTAKPADTGMAVRRALQWLTCEDVAIPTAYRIPNDARSLSSLRDPANAGEAVQKCGFCNIRQELRQNRPQNT